MKKSLLWKSNSRNQVFREKDYKIISMDLGLKNILGIMSREPEIHLTKEIFLSSVSYSIEDIIYRQGILSSLDQRNDSLGLLDIILSNLNEMQNLHKTLKPDKLVPFTMLRFRKLESYCKVMDGLRTLFCENDNENISDIAAEIEDEYINSGISEIKQTLTKCREIIISFKSLDLGINLDEKGLVREAIILRFNDFLYNKNSLIEKVTAEFIKDRNIMTVAPVQEIYEKGQYIMFANRLYEEFEPLLNSEIHKIINLLDKHSEVLTSSVIPLKEELLIYYGAIRLKNFLNSRDLPVTLPGVISDEINIMDLFSLTMALESITDRSKQINVVKNELVLENDTNLLVITGPNDGGKTVFLEAITILQLLGQNGIYCPAASAEIKIYKSIFTHFPKDEDISFGTGRLGEEAGRFSDILNSIESPALISTNEPYVTTSPDEGLLILAHTIKKLCLGEADIFIVTHYLDLLEELGPFSHEKTYTAELKDGKRTYKMIPDKPMSLSHAMDIAKQHGIDKESIIELMNKRM